MIAIAAPVFDQRTTSAPLTFGDATHGSREWAILRNLRSALQDFWRINTGMIEAGAESPYDFVSTAIQQLVTPKMYDDQDQFEDTSWTYLCETTFVMDYPGDSIPNVIKAQF